MLPDGGLASAWPFSYGCSMQANENDPATRTHLGRASLKRLFRYIAPYWHYYVVTILFGIF